MFRQKHLRRTIPLLLALILLVTLFAGCAKKKETSDLTQLTEVTEIVGGALSPFYYQWAVADGMGYWKEEGLTVKFLAVDGGSSAYIQQLEAGQGQFTQPSPTNLFAAAQQGFLKNTIAVGTWLYEQPFALKVVEGSPVKSIQDLKGKIIGISDMSGGEVPLLVGTLKTFYGMEQDKDYQLLPIGDTGQSTYEAIKNNKVQAYCTAAKDFLPMQAFGLKFTDITPKEWASLPANVLVANKQLYTEHPEVVVGFLRGLAKATVFTAANVDAAYKVISASHPEMVQDRDPQFVKDWIKLTQESVYPQNLVDKKRLMEVEVEDLAGYVDYLKKIGELPQDANIDVKSMVTNDLIDQVNNFDYAAIQKQAADYK